MRILRLTRLLVALSAMSLTGCERGPGEIEIPPASVNVDCSVSTVSDVSSDPSMPGPWLVSAKTTELSDGHGRTLKTEIWYPAVRGSEPNSRKRTYDLKQFLPDVDAAKIPESVDTLQHCDCYSDLPLDVSHGAYPIIVLIHGSSSFRTASLTQAVHWASRGFVVISADNPYIQLKDFKANPLNSLFEEQARDTANIIKQLHELPASIAFLENHIDTNRIGIAGHSAGGIAAASLGSIPGVRVIIPMAAGGVHAGSYLRSSLIMGAVDDKVVRYPGQQMGYSTTPKPKRFIGIDNAGHMAFTDICTLMIDQGGIIEVARQYGVSIPWYLESLGRDGCGAKQLPPQMSSTIVNYATTAAFEEVLQCRADSTSKLAEVKTIYPGVKDFKETL